MGRDAKRRRKTLIKGIKSLKKKVREHIDKSSRMKKTSESEGYALKEAEQFSKQAKIRASKLKTLRKKKWKVFDFN